LLRQGRSAGQGDGEQGLGEGDSTVYRWQPAFQADFAERLDGCVKPYAEANHPPVVRIRGERVRKVDAGNSVDLDARDTTDPDGDGLDFSWVIYPIHPDLAREVAVEGRGSQRARVVVHPTPTGQTIPILLAVTDRGHPRLTRYGRVLIMAERVKVAR